MANYPQIICYPFLSGALVMKCVFAEINRIYDGAEAKTRKSQARFQII